MLTRQQILTVASHPLPRVEVQVPALGGAIFVRTLSAGERDLFEIAHTKAKGGDFRARLVVACACDQNGVDLFQLADVPTISKMPTSAIEPIVKAALALNAFGDADENPSDAIASGGTSVGNSETPTTPSTDSHGVSPPTFK